MVIVVLIASRVYVFTLGPGIDDLLSKHMSHLFIRDPLVVFSETIDQDDTTSSDHFEVRYARFVDGAVIHISKEYTINQLADSPIQTPSTQLTDWLAC